MRRTRIVFGAACAAALVVAVACGSGRDQTASTVPARASSAAISVDVVQVVEQQLNVMVKLPGELTPYETVDIYPKVTGFVRSLGVDRGSNVKKGEVIARLDAPELMAQLSEAQSKSAAAQAQVAAAQAKLAADHSTYEKLSAAAKTPGVIAQNDLVVAKHTEESDQANVQAAQNAAQATQSALQSVKQTEAYLEITAPFDGVVTERRVHPGALVGPAGGSGAATPMMRIETLARLRLTVALPETQAAAIPAGTQVEFTVPQYPGEKFHGPIARIARSVDAKTRTMPVELEVANPSGRLAAGSYCEVAWPVRRLKPTLFVPASSIATNLERTFVIRVRGNKTEWVDVKTGATSGSLIEVFGDLRAGDEVVQRASDSIRADVDVTPKLVTGS